MEQPNFENYGSIAVIDRSGAYPNHSLLADMGSQYPEGYSLLTPYQRAALAAGVLSIALIVAGCGGNPSPNSQYNNQNDGNSCTFLIFNCDSTKNVNDQQKQWEKQQQQQQQQNQQNGAPPHGKCADGTEPLCDSSGCICP